MSYSVKGIEHLYSPNVFSDVNDIWEVILYWLCLPEVRRPYAISRSFLISTEDA